MAKGLQLVGGLALLLNRMVPLALAAMVSVNVCGAFVALLIEGEAVLALLALLVLALNALLMFAYLPAYRGVLAAGALADGEGAEPGENYESSFSWPTGTISKRTMIKGLVVLLAAYWFYYDVVPFANGTTGRYTLLFPAAILAINIVRGFVGKKAD